MGVAYVIIKPLSNYKFSVIFLDRSWKQTCSSVCAITSSVDLPLWIFFLAPNHQLPACRVLWHNGNLPIHRSLCGTIKWF